MHSTKQKCNYNYKNAGNSLLLPKLWGPSKSEALGLSLFSLMVNPRLRESLQSGTRIGLLSIFLHKKCIHSHSFYLSGPVKKSLKFCVAYVPCWFLKMAVIISHSHLVHVEFVSVLVFQTFDRMIFDKLSFLEQDGTW